MPIMLIQAHYSFSRNPNSSCPGFCLSQQQHHRATKSFSVTTTMRLNNTNLSSSSSSSSSSRRGVVFSASLSLNNNKRRVVEHVCLLKANKDLSDEEEKDMLDYLYTSQYQMGGVVAISLGPILDQNLENYTHAVYMRFHRKKDLEKFYQNPSYTRILEEHVVPYCHGSINVDYESQVEDDILPIFRKGEDYNYGVEFVLLIAFSESTTGATVEDAMNSFARLTMEFPSLIVQSTQGANFNPSNKEYTHGMVIRFRSLEAFEIFFGSPEYKNIWRSQFELITQKTLSVHFSIDPVGTEVM